MRLFPSQPIRREIPGCTIGCRRSACGGAPFSFELPAADPAPYTRDDSGGHLNPHR